MSQLFDVPDDVRLYVLIHFFMPFVKAERESVRIDHIKSCPSNSSDTQSVKSKKVRDLLTDPTMELDARILDGRIEKYVDLLNEQLCYGKISFNDAVISVLRKGVLVGDTYAFHKLYMKGLIDESTSPLFVERILAKMRVLPKNEFFISEFFSFVRYLLEKEMVTTLREVLILNSAKKGPRLCISYFTTKEQDKIKTLGIELF